MRRVETSAVEVLGRFAGTCEVPGPASNPAILSWLRLADPTAALPAGDETPWCSAALHFVARVLGLARPEKLPLRARSWLTVGRPVRLEEAEAGLDVVVLGRGPRPRPGPEVIDAPGHVGLYLRRQGDRVELLGGNQGDAVNASWYPVADVLGVRRLA